MGIFGVDMFFALSGFLITSLLVEEFRAKGEISLPRFYMRRVLRLYPALLLLCIVAFAVALHDGVSVGKELTSLLPVLIYMSDYVRHLAHPLVHTWSLAAEKSISI